jgi:UPF0755 protein
LRRLLAIGLLLVLALTGWLVREATRPLGRGADAIEVRVPTGSGARAIARSLQEAGLDVPRWEFVALAELAGASRHLRAGRYRILPDTALPALVQKFHRGEVEPESIVFLEGETFAQLRARLAAHPDLRHDTVSLDEAHILMRLGDSQNHAEGLFAPDTYQFDPGASDLDILRQALQRQRERLAQVWGTREDALPIAGTYELLTLASLVEKETGVAADRERVAGVFVNRLRIGMALQTDPSVIYGLGEQYSGRLHRADLRLDTPFNTYTRAGLPPTPICAPGLRALQAAAHPAQGKALYFVARGDGSSQFSETLLEHQRAVEQFLKLPHRSAGAGS